MTRVLVILPNWFGETLFATPFLRALRRRHQGAFIAALGRPACREILLHNPLVNDLVNLDERPAGLARLVQTLRRHRFDTAFILRRSLTRTILAALGGAARRIGFDNAKSGWTLTQRVRPAAGAVHKAASYLPLLGEPASTLGLAFDYTVSDEERRAARALLADYGLTDGGPLAVLHPGANWDHKRWPAERFAQLGNRLAEAGARIVVTGSPDDISLAAAVAGGMQRPAAVLAGRTTLRQLAACLEQAALVVSNDTGVLHVAAALRRPLVGLYGPTSPALTGPLGEGARITVLHKPDCCPRIPCYAPGKGADHPGMAAISVEEAFNASTRLLERVP